MQRAKEGDMVRVHCAGRLVDGQTFELSREPMDLIIGHRDLLPELEQAVVGLAVRESRTVIIPKGKGFNSRREELVQVVAREDFPPGIDPKVGMRVRVPASGYEVIDATVIKVTQSEITLDGNHPLADQDALIEITLLEIIA